MLPAVNALKQVTLFKAIFSLLFRDESALQNSTPVRKQALLAAADAVDKEPGFVNHAEIFRAYGLPHNALKLRKLAGK
jgi:hypothetical protein